MSNIRFPQKAAVVLAILRLAVIPVLSLSLQEGPQYPDAAAAWVDANSGRLPSNYGTFSEYSLLYRRAIYPKLDAETRAQLWTDHWEFYRLKHPELTTVQNEVLDILTKHMNGPAEEREKTDFSTLAESAFDLEQRRLLLSVLRIDDQHEFEGHEDETLQRRQSGPICTCSSANDWCSGSTKCVWGGCVLQSNGCGTI